MSAALCGRGAAKWSAAREQWGEETEGEGVIAVCGVRRVHRDQGANESGVEADAKSARFGVNAQRRLQAGTGRDAASFSIHSTSRQRPLAIAIELT